MSARNRGLSVPMKNIPHGALVPPGHEAPLGSRGIGSMAIPHHALLEEMRDSQMRMGPRGLPPHPAILEERLSAQHHEIQGLLVDNQRLAATHVALKQELEVTQHELQQFAHVSNSMRAEDMKARELFEKSIKMEMDLRGVENMRGELMKLHGDIKELGTARQELTGQVQALNQDFVRATADLQQAPALKAEIEAMKHELQRARAAIEYENKGCAENYERGQIMDKDLMSMTRELEKLRAEVSNAEKRARAAAAATAAANHGYGGNYGGTQEAGNPYSGSYGVNPGQAGAESFPQYGPGPTSWGGGAYEMQRGQGHR